MSELQLPDSVRSLVEMHPAEDLALQVLRKGLPDIPIRTRVPGDLEAFRLVKAPDGVLIVVRRAGTYGLWDGDTRFVDHAGIEVQVFVYGEDAEERAALVQEAVRVTFRNSMLQQDYYPGLGCINWHYVEEEGRRKTDWATSTGPVQYADLPVGWERYESRHQLKIRRPIWG